MRSMQISLPYGKDEICLTIPTETVGEIISPKEVTTTNAIEKEITRALDDPIESKKIEELVSHEDRVLLVVDDLTRKTPVHRIIPIIIQRLIKKGVKRENIKILVALGTHRPMGEGEIDDRFGREINRRFEIVNHSLDSAHLLDLGSTRNGTPIKVNRLVVWADLVLGIGAIIPHHLCGFSGGAKIIQPGICGADTTAQTHLLGVRYKQSLLGKVENEVRREMEEIASRVEMMHIFNVVLDRQGNLFRAFFGGYRKAFRKGVEAAKEVYRANFSSRVPVVIASSHPCDIDFWQAHKTLYAADRVCEEGGSIVIVTPCPEGIAQTHPEITSYAYLSWKEIREKVNRKELSDYVGAALALAWAKIREHKRILVVSQGISRQEAKRLGFIYHHSIESSIRDCLEYHGKEAKISVLSHGGETLPMLEEG